MTRLTVHRALLDWHNRPRSRRDEVNVGEGQGASALPGLVGQTRHRIVLDVQHDRVRARLIAICEEGIDHPGQSEGMLTQLTVIRKQLIDAAPTRS